MTDRELVNYYVNLLIAQYGQKPKAVETVRAIIGMIISGQLPLEIQSAFDIDRSSGASLKILASYFGAPTSYVKDGRVIQINDSDLKTLIKILIVKNRMGHSLYDIQRLLKDFFGDNLIVTDHEDMSLTYSGSSFVVDQNILDFLNNSDFLPRPTGVRIREINITATTKFFGFGYFHTENQYVKGLNHYQQYDEMAPWLTYTSTIPTQNLMPPINIQEFYGFRRYTLFNSRVYSFNRYTNYDSTHKWLRYT